MSNVEENVRLDSRSAARELEAALDGRYTIERELGGGAMSRVFLARETALGRRVVVKVLSPDVAEELSAERFEREIRLAARLQHPNIVPVLAAGVADGIPYYTMPYVEGESLRVRLAGGIPLSVVSALGILRDVARALAYAHGQGVVHRDIKPENILLSDDSVVVADFGIAKALTAATLTATRDTQSENLTRRGTALGTPAYMAPEQAVGDPKVDHRADLYAWGVVAYELLAGHHPFADKRTPHALIAAHLVELPAPLGEAGIERSLASLVMQALEKDAANRPATAKMLIEVLSASPTPSSGSVLHGASTQSSMSVAVLPFANVGGITDDEYFADGMTEEAINAIGRLPGVRVAARTSSFAFKGHHADLRTIAQQLRVGTILEGSVRRSGTQVRISVQLSSARDGLHLWNERYDRELADIFALQDEIASAIASSLRDRLGSASRVATAPQSLTRARVDPVAYDLYLRGRFLFEQHSPLEAVATFDRAIEIDPGFALAHAWAGLAIILAANHGVVPANTAYPLGKARCDTALALDPSLAESHLLGSLYLLWYDRDPVNAERRAREAVAIAPSMTHAIDMIGWSLLAQHRLDEAIVSMEQALALDPLADFMLLNLALALMLVGSSDRAIKVLRPALVRSPGSGPLHLALGFALLTSDRPIEAQSAFERSRELVMIGNRATAGLSCALAARGDAEAARRMLDEARELAERGRGSATDVAIAYHWLGDDDSAQVWLERALQAQDMWLIFLALDPRLKRLRGSPSFQALLQRIAPR